jgi:nitric oxide dioxygenase
VSPPYGNFTPDIASNETIVLLSAGVGITPMISVLNAIARSNPGRHVIFGHAARSALHHAHRADLAAAAGAMPNLTLATFYETMPEPGQEPGALEGLMTVARLPAWPRGEADVYLCGPTGFMRAQWTALVAAGVPVTRLHREVFGPDLLDSLN